MLGFLLRIIALVSVLLAGIAGYAYYVLSTPLNVNNYKQNVGQMCKAAVYIGLSQASRTVTMTPTRCDCVIRETTNVFGAQRAAEMFETIRILTEKKVKGASVTTTNAQEEMMSRLLSSNVGRSCGLGGLT